MMSSVDNNTFSDASSEAVGFEPQGIIEKVQKGANVQTEVVVYESEEVQVVETKSIETQTVEPPVKLPAYNYDSLANFLKRITPGVLQFLDEQHGTNAFDDYDTSGNSETATNIQLINRLNSLDMSDFKGKISSVTWSTGGGTLAVAHSAKQHETWCNDFTKIEFFNLSKDNLLMSKPSKTLDVSSCVTSLVYHPEEPSIIAAGLFNGDVLVWNLRDESSVTPLQICTHGDLVSQVQWHLRILNDASVLVTSSADGFISVHKLTVNFTQAALNKRYKIAKEKNPAEKTRPQSAGGSKERAAEAGLHITCFDFSSKNQNMLVVGTLCGGLYKCMLEHAVPIKGDETIFDPVVDEYDRHKATVTCVKSASIKNLFVSCAADKEIRIYDFDQFSVPPLLDLLKITLEEFRRSSKGGTENSPVLRATKYNMAASLRTITVQNTVIQITWFFGNPDIFLAYGAGSEVKFFNVNNGRALSKIMLYSESRENASCLSFNPRREMVAIGDTRGNLEIWRMPRNLTP